MSANQSPSKNPVKVLYLITKSNFGGAQRYVYDLATHLPADQFEAVVAFGGTGAIASDTGELAGMLTVANIRTIHIKKLGRNINLFADVLSFFAILRTIRAEKPNVLHLNSSKAAGLGTLAGRLAGVPRILYTAHGWPFWEDRPFIVRGIIFFFSWLTVMLAHKTICVSEFDRLQFSRFPFMRTRLITIRNGIASINYLDRSVARTSLYDNEIVAAQAQHIWLGTIAELHPNKNLARAIDAVLTYNQRHDRKIFYTIIGSGELEKELMKKPDRNISLLGFLPSAARYLKAFDVFLLPSLKEGLPYVVLEAATAGVPVVASDVGGIPEILEGARDGFLVNPRDSESIVQGLHSAAHPSPLAQGESLAALIHERCSHERMLETTFSLYKRS